jgi:hypothetical protein
MFFIVGVIGLTVSLVAFWYCLPKDGRLMPLVGTMWEPYVAIALTMGSILSFGAIAISVVDYFV